jgi:hypothetical protein
MRIVSTVLPSSAPAAAVGELLELLHLAQRHARRLLEQAGEARVEAVAGDRIAHRRRRADRDGAEVLHLAKHLRMAGEARHAGMAVAAAADRPRQLEMRIAFDRGDVLVLRDLAVADDPDPSRHV